MKTDIYRQAVRNNDAKFYGAFVYALITKKIYCKPSYSLRLPKRENVLSLDDFQKLKQTDFVPVCDVAHKVKI